MHQRYPLDPATGACTPLGVTGVQANKLTRCHCRLRIEGESPENTLVHQAYIGVLSFGFVTFQMQLATLNIVGIPFSSPIQQAYN